MDLIDIQQVILQLIVECIQIDGVLFFQVEIVCVFGFKGVCVVQYYLEVLEQVGVICCIFGQVCGIWLVQVLLLQDGLFGLLVVVVFLDYVLCLLVFGWVVVGLLIGVDIGLDDFVVLDWVFFLFVLDYLLKVQGDLMIDEGIFDGDLIGVYCICDVWLGQIVVVCIDDEIMVKLLKMGKDCIWFLFCNFDYKLIEVLFDQDFVIEGFYCGLLWFNCQVLMLLKYVWFLW